MNKINKTLLLLGVILVNSCGNGGHSSNSGNNVNPQPVSNNVPLTIDTSGDIPSPNGGGVSTVVYVHNNSNKVISGIRYYLAENNSINTNELKIILNKVRTFLNLDISNSANGFTLDKSFNSNCTNIAAYSSCPIRFNTPGLVNIGTRANVLLTATNNQFQYSQVLNTYYYQMGKNSAVNFSDSSPDIVTSKSTPTYITEYIIADGNPGDIYSNINFNIMPNNTLNIFQGIDKNTEITSGEVIAVEFKNTFFSNSLTSVSIQPAANLKHDNVKSKAQTLSTGYALTLGILPTANANLVVGNTTILTSTSNSQSISIVNNGTVNGVVSLNINGNFTNNGNCNGTTLAPGGSCSFINQVGTTPNAVESGNIVYSITNSLGNAIVSPLLYINPYNIPVIIVSPSSTNMSFSPNQSAAISYTISNIGQAPLNNMTHQSVKTGNSYITESNNTCSTTLAGGASCTISGSVTSGNSAESSVVAEKISGTYASQTYYSLGSTNITVLTNPLLTLSPASPLIIPTIRGNNIESASNTYTVTNSVPNSIAVIKSESAVLPSSSVSQSANTCTSGTSLSYNQSCTIILKSGPVLNTNSNESGTFPVTITYSAPANNVGVLTTTGNVSYSIIAQDTSLNITNLSAAGLTGSGTSVSPYSILSYESVTNTPSVTITYQNTSVNYSLSSFALQTASISPIWTIDGSSTCGYGSTLKTLAASGSCFLKLNLNRAYVYNVNPIATSSIGFNFPNASWQESGTNSLSGIIIQNNMSFNNAMGVFVNYINTIITSTVSTAFPTSTGNLTLNQTITNAPSYMIPVTISSLNGFNNPIESITTGANYGVINSDGSITFNYNNVNQTSSTAYTFNVPTAGGFLPIVQPIIFTTTLAAPASVGFNPYYFIESMAN